MRRVQQQERIPALAWVVLLPDQTPRIEASGLGIDTRTPFRFGSITKTFTAIALMNAAEAKGIPLDTPLNDIVGSRFWRNRFDQTLTLRHLLTLTAGHTDLSWAAFDDNTPRPLRDSLELNQAALESLWPPGLAHGYSNATPGLSALVIETLTGQDYVSAMSDLLVSRLALRDAGFSEDAGLPGGFRADGKTPIPYWHMTFPAFGGLNMSIADLTSFLQVAIADGYREGTRIWSSGTNELLLSPSAGLAHSAGLDVGYAAGMYSRVSRGQVWHTHGGDADGYRSRYALLPSHQAGYAVVFNTDNPGILRRLESILETHIIDKLALPAPATPTEIPQVDHHDGEYYPITTRFERTAWQQCTLSRLILRTRASGIEITTGKTSNRLRHLGNNRFAAAGAPVATAVITRHTDGAVYLLGEYGNYVRVSTPDVAAPVVIPSFLPTCLKATNRTP